MVVLLLLNLAASVAMMIIGLALAPLRGRFFGDVTYQATIPTLVQVGLAGAVAFAGLPWPRGRFFFLLVSCLFLGLLGIPVHDALMQWPSHDDSGWGWMFFLWLSCLVGISVAFATLAVGATLEFSPGSRTAFRSFFATIARRSLPSSEERPQAPRRLPRPIVWVFRSGAWALAGAYAFWLFAGPYSWDTFRTEDFPGGIAVRHTDRHVIAPYLALLSSGVDTDRGQILLHNGRQLMKGEQPASATWRFAPSPTGAFAVAEDGQQKSPMKILATAEDRSIEVVNDDVSRREFGYTGHYSFMFLRWEDGSHFTIAEVHSWDSKTPAFREVWRVAAENGERTRVGGTDGPEGAPAP